MKPFWIANMLLSLLLLAGCVNSAAFARFDHTAGAYLEASIHAAAQAHWQEADDALASAEHLWHTYALYFHIVSDQNEIEEADTLLSQARLYLHQKDRNNYEISMQSLLLQVHRICENQSFSLKTFL